MVQRFGSGPEQDPNRDRRAQGDRKPVPTRHQGLGIFPSQPDTTKRQQADQNASQQAKERRQRKKPAEVIQHKSVGHFHPFPEWTWVDQIQNDRTEDQQKRWPENYRIDGLATLLRKTCIFQMIRALS